MSPHFVSPPAPHCPLSEIILSVRDALVKCFGDQDDLVRAVAAKCFGPLAPFMNDAEVASSLPLLLTPAGADWRIRTGGLLGVAAMIEVRQ